MNIAQRLLWICHGPLAIAVLNVLVVVVSFLVIQEMMGYLWNSVSDVHRIEDTMSGLVIILIAYGVALESRESLLKIYGLYPRFCDPRQEAVDHVCHDYGLLYLVLGLAMEVAVQALAAPDAIINTHGIEGAILTITVAFLVLAMFLLVKHSILLVKLRVGPMPEPAAGHHGGH